MYGTHEQLYSYLHYTTYGHRYPPVVHTVVYREQLQLIQSDTVSLSTVVNSLSLPYQLFDSCWAWLHAHEY